MEEKVEVSEIKGEAPRGIERVIIDTDPGIDDCMALFLALSRPDRIRVEGITIVFGNNDDLDILARNACLCIHMAKAGEIPVYKGATRPLEVDYHGQTGKEVHGSNGVGGVPIEEPPNTHLIQQTSAIDFIIKTCKENPGEITLITLGPLTNIAMAVKACPELPQYAKRVVTMGGVLNERGNKTPLAEANFNNDARAAKIVMNAKFKLTLSPLNVTRLIHMNTQFMHHVRDLGAIGKFIHDMLLHYRGINEKWGTHPEEIPMHDSTAVMAVLEPKFYTKQTAVYIDVEADSELCDGLCAPDWRGHWRKDPKYHLNTTALLDVDADGFKQFYLECITALVARVNGGQ